MYANTFDKAVAANNPALTLGVATVMRVSACPHPFSSEVTAEHLERLLGLVTCHLACLSQASFGLGIGGHFTP
jgi:hypothetical protein